MNSSKPEHELTRRIRIQETGPDGEVDFATYVRLMEETEYAFLRGRGLSVVLSDDRGTIGFPRLSAAVEIENPAPFDRAVTTVLKLADSDGKQIVYKFSLTSADQPVATGRFVVACCRFPSGELPYAILTPEFVLESLYSQPRTKQRAKEKS